MWLLLFFFSLCVHVCTCVRRRTIHTLNFTCAGSDCVCARGNGMKSAPTDAQPSTEVLLPTHALYGQVTAAVVALRVLVWEPDVTQPA